MRIMRWWEGSELWAILQSSCWSQMERTREFLVRGDSESKSVSALEVRPHRAGLAASFFEALALRGIRVDSIQRGSLTCTFTVPPRLTVSSWLPYDEGPRDLWDQKMETFFDPWPICVWITYQWFLLFFILQGVDGNLSAGAIANLVDEIGGAVILADGQHTKVSVDMSISYMSAARIHVNLLTSPPLLA